MIFSAVAWMHRVGALQGDVLVTRHLFLTGKTNRCNVAAVGRFCTWL